MVHTRRAVRGGVDSLFSPSTFLGHTLRRATRSLLAVVMDIPTPRELELETLLRQRDAQVAELTVRIVVWQLIAYASHVLTRPRMKSRTYGSILRVNHPHQPPSQLLYLQR